jgi:Zn-dependent protease
MQRSRGLKVFSVRGIDIKIDASLIILLVYVVLVASVRLPAVAAAAGIDPDSLSFGPVVAGIIFALGLLVSVVLHELGHSLYAKSHGVGVKRITLMMLGGVSEIEKIPEKKYFEFKLAVIGPLVSLALWVILGFVRTHTSSPNVGFFAYWLSSANLVLGIFNLIPAFPLDGGRALRSLLVARLGMIRGTRASVSVSKAFAVFFGIVGFLQFNIILMLIAFFVYANAESELYFLVSRDLLKGIKVGEVTVRVAPLSSTASVESAAFQMVRLRTTVMPVTVDSQPGLPALLSLAQLRTFPREQWGATPVSQAMIESPKSLDPDEAVSQILQDVATAPLRALPVARSGEILGVVRYSDIAEILELKSIEERHGPEDKVKPAA